MEPNKVRDAYNYARYLPERRKMMQAWGDYLESLENGEGKRMPNVSLLEYEVEFRLKDASSLMIAT